MQRETKLKVHSVNMKDDVRDSASFTETPESGGWAWEEAAES